MQAWDTKAHSFLLDAAKLAPGRHRERLNIWPLERSAVREIKIKIEDIYVPVKRRKTYDPERAGVLAEDILVRGQESAILVRKDNERFVLVEGLHRLEACKALGEKTILACIVQARRP
jgi:uncharacterized ParB-like nuclease family protein